MEELKVAILIGEIVALLLSVYIIIYILLIESGLAKWFWRKWKLRGNDKRLWYTGSEVTRITAGIDSDYNDEILLCKCGTNDCKYCNPKKQES